MKMRKIYKKTYTPPKVEKVEFNYSEQVVAASGCDRQWVMKDDHSCTDHSTAYTQY